MTPKLLSLLPLTLACSPAFAQTTYPEVEPNWPYNLATVVSDMSPGDTVTGSASTHLPTSANGTDLFRIRTVASPPAIYLHRLTLTATRAGAKSIIPGIGQNFTPGVGGVAVGPEVLLQVDGTVPLESQWYGFGGGEEIYYMVQSNTSLPNAYSATLSTSTVAVTSMTPVLEAGQLTITTRGLTVDNTTIHVFDANFNALPGYSNDDETVTGTTKQSSLRRNFVPGTYYLAVGASNTAWDIPAPGDENLTQQIVNQNPRGLLFFPGALVQTPSSGNALDLDFRIVAGNGILFQSAQLPAGHPTDVLWFRFTVGVGAPILNDDCAGAGAIYAGESYTASFAAAQSNGSSSCDAGGSSSRDYWYSYTNPTGAAVALRIDTCGSASDTALAILASCAGPELACNDDSPSGACGPTVSRTSLLVQAGQTVYVRVSDKGVSGTTFVLNTSAEISNDECTTPKALPGAGQYPIDNEFATTSASGQTEAACAFPGGPAFARDLWYTYTPLILGPVQISTCGLVGGGPSDDSKIAVYAGTGCPTPGTAIACSDYTFPACVGGSGNNATLNFNPVCGTTYLIQIGMSPLANGPMLGNFQLLEQGPALGAWCYSNVVTFCTGEGLGSCTACGNNGQPGRGCANSAYPQGSGFVATGIASVTPAFDTFVLTATNITGPGLFFQSNLSAGLQGFGDGILCAYVGITRLAVVFPVGGVAVYPNALAPVPIHTAGAPIAAGATKFYQCWYRDAAPFCSSATYNTTPALSVVWYP